MIWATVLKDILMGHPKKIAVDWSGWKLLFDDIDTGRGNMD